MERKSVTRRFEKNSIKTLRERRESNNDMATCRHGVPPAPERPVYAMCFVDLPAGHAISI